MSGLFYPKRSPNLDQNLLKLRSYEEKTLYTSPALMDKMVTLKQPRISRTICKGGLVLFIVLMVLVTLVLQSGYNPQGSHVEKTFHQRVTVIPVRECVKGKCYTYSSRDEEYADYFIPRKQKLNPFPFKFLIPGREVCDMNHPPYLVILVPSLHVHVEARRAIRKTWGSVSQGNLWPRHNINVTIKLVFLFGKDPNRNVKLDRMIENESRLYHDVILGDFNDSYSNLSRKILMGLNWVTHYCSDAAYILKADDDTFVNIPRLLGAIKNISHPRYKGVIIGKIYDTATVRRHGRWEVTSDTYPFARYPKYACGNSYVISGNIASILFSTSAYMPYIPIEDAYITGVLAKTIDAEHIDIPGFTYWFDKPPKACDFITDRKISSTNASPNNMLYIWKRLGSDILKCNSTL